MSLKLNLKLNLKLGLKLRTEGGSREFRFEERRKKVGSREGEEERRREVDPDWPDPTSDVRKR